MTCGTHIHGEHIVHGLRIESLSIEVCKRRSNFLKALCCSLYGSLLAQNDRARLSVSMDLWMSSQTTKCERDLVLELRWNGVPARGSPYLCLGGLKSKVD